MNTTIAIGFATTAATLLLTVVLFATDRVLLRVREGRQRERELVARVLDVVDKAVRLMARPVFARVWTNDELEFTLLLPRLYLDLPRRHRHIAWWSHRQIQKMQRTANSKDRLALQLETSEALIRWHLREISIEWFAKQLEVDPVESPFRMDMQTKTRRVIHDSWGWAQWLGVLAAIGYTIRQAVTR